ncbi:MAG TPA: DUF1579 family protein [Usitatibacter sp.]|nr:DUF1579 family protein [Usitatibacter sp.]
MRILSFAWLALMAIAALAQVPSVGCNSPESHQMDFWLGEWDAQYVMNGVQGASHNRITKMLDGCAILEEFTGAPGMPLEGRSYSVYDRNAGAWKQTWVDNQGGYLDFVGGLEEGNRVFARQFQRQGKTTTQRMVFRDVKPDAFKWLWQNSTDGGATWNTAWEIDYRRVK